MIFSCSNSEVQQKWSYSILLSSLKTCLIMCAFIEKKRESHQRNSSLQNQESKESSRANYGKNQKSRHCRYSCTINHYGLQGWSFCAYIIKARFTIQSFFGTGPLNGQIITMNLGLTFTMQHWVPQERQFLFPDGCCARFWGWIENFFVMLSQRFSHPNLLRQRKMCR